MKLGIAGHLGDASPAAIHRVRELGFAAASWHLPELSLARDRTRLAAVREGLEAAGVELCQLLPPDYPSLVAVDPSERAAGVEALKTVLAAAGELGAPNVYVRPGSLNPAGPWTPHPDNHRPETRRRLVESLKSLLPAAEATGIPLALEGHVVSPLSSVEAVAEVLEAVGSPLLGFNADPVNLIGDLDTAFDPAGLVDRLFDRLGGAIVCAHAKDVTVGDRLVVHIEECVPGQGYLDQEQFLRRFESVAPRGAVLIEHLPWERMAEARRAMLEFAARAGLQFEAS